MGPVTLSGDPTLHLRSYNTDDAVAYGNLFLGESSSRLCSLSTAWKTCNHFALKKGRGCLREHICSDGLFSPKSGDVVIELRALELNPHLEKQNEDKREV